MKAEASVAHVLAAEETTRKSNTSGPIPDLVWAFHPFGRQPVRWRSMSRFRLFPGATVAGSVFGMNTKGLPFTDLDTAFLWALLLMVLSSFAAYLIMKRFGIIR